MFLDIELNNEWIVEKENSYLPINFSQMDIRGCFGTEEEALSKKGH